MRLRLRGGMARAGRFGVFKYARPKGMPSIRCCPFPEICVLPHKVLARTSGVSKGRILNDPLVERTIFASILGSVPSLFSQENILRYEVCKLEV